jgi:hypothetical protein
MAQAVNRLSAIKVQKNKTPGLYADGAGLYLQVTGKGAKSWIFRYSLRSRAREMGLGSLRKISLADARRKAAECHRLLEAHVDPIEDRKRARAAMALANAETIVFKEAAARYIAMRAVWAPLAEGQQKCAMAAGGGIRRTSTNNLACFGAHGEGSSANKP